MPRALVTGAAGFVGQWLCAELLRRGWDVVGTTLEESMALSRLSADEHARVTWLRADVRARGEVAAALDRARPDAIFHLAAVASVRGAHADPEAALDVNVVAAARLLAEVRARRAAGTVDPVVFVVGSGEQYGAHDAAEMPLREEAAQRPVSVYAASKVAQEVVALEAWRSDGVRVVATRSFNHSGAGQAGSYLLPELVRRAVALRGSRGCELAIGNTAPVRDFLHVADVVRAYVDLAERGTAGEVYNVASGRGVEVGAMARRVLELVGVEAKLRSDPALVRRVDVPVLVGDPSKLRAATGWSPTSSLDAILEDLIRAATR